MLADSAKRGVSSDRRSSSLGLRPLTTATGSKDRLDRAKTIDLCQNPLTVCLVTSATFWSYQPRSSFFRKSPSSRARARSLNGRNTTERSPPSRENWRPKDVYRRALPRRTSTSSPTAARRQQSLAVMARMKEREIIRLRRSTHMRLHGTSCDEVAPISTVKYDRDTVGLKLAPVKTEASDIAKP